MTRTNLAVPLNAQRTTRPAKSGQTDATQPKPTSEGRSNAGNTHISGEMSVAAELAKRGYSV
jgi:hypothetical protein